MGNTGSLVFSFDHETSWSRPRVRNGLWGKSRYIAKCLANWVGWRYDFYYERGRGWGQRLGAENAHSILQDYDVKATWFCTGYALLDGNPAKRTFAGNPRQPYATRENCWYPDSLWRATQGYFDEDPFTTWRENAEWYFGDQVRRLHASGQDIECHTFCHLYVALETAPRLESDLQAWQAAAQVLGLLPATSLSCPQESFLYLLHIPTGGIRPNPGRDLGAEYHAEIVSEEVQAAVFDAGIRVITRVPEWYWHQHYPTHQPAWLGEHKPLMLIPGKSWKPSESPSKPKEYIDQLARTKGVGDLWCHPGNVLTRQEIRNFRCVIAYARERADQGDLSLAPISVIYRSLARHHPGAAWRSAG